MANIFDYIAWRGDLTFEQDPFGEVDNLVLAMLSYTDFEDVVPGQDSDEKISIQEAEQRYFSLHTVEELMARETYVKTVPLLLKSMAASKRYADVRFYKYINVLSNDTREQMSAVMIDVGDGTVYASFRGTDGSITGWKEDLELCYSEATSGQEHAALWLSKCALALEKDVKLRVGGHSKGGNFAVYASAFCEESVKNRIIAIYSNDGPGFVEKIVHGPEYTGITEKIFSYVPEESVFGQLMYSKVPDQVIHSSAKGIVQHDALSWEVLGNHFLKAQSTSGKSEFLDKTLTEWIEDFSPQEREAFLEKMFRVLDTSGAETLSDLKRLKVKDYMDMFRTYKQMDDEEQSSIRSTFGSLARSVKDNLVAELPTKTEIAENIKDSAAKPVDFLEGVVANAIWAYRKHAQKSEEKEENAIESAETAEKRAESVEAAEKIAEFAEAAEKIAESAEAAEKIAESVEAAEKIVKSAEAADGLTESAGIPETITDPDK